MISSKPKASKLSLSVKCALHSTDIFGNEQRKKEEGCIMIVREDSGSRLIWVNTFYLTHTENVYFPIQLQTCFSRTKFQSIIFNTVSLYFLKQIRRTGNLPYNLQFRLVVGYRLQKISFKRVLYFQFKHLEYFYSAVACRCKPGMVYIVSALPF